MAASLTRQLLEQHRVPSAHAESGRPGERQVLPDHVLLSGLSGRIALAAFLSLGTRTRRALALACLDPGGGRGSVPALDFAASADAARRAGIQVAPYRSGECDLIHRERFGAPEKLVVAAGPAAYSAGALGALSLAIDPLEAAATLAGAPLHLADPPVARIRLEGGLAPGVSGADVALAVRSRLARWEDPVVEFAGRGVAALPVVERIAVAALAVRLGARAALFPSDERTRRYLTSQRREADWKSLEAASAADESHDLLVELDDIEPLLAAEEDVAGARPVRHAMGMMVSRVMVGGSATLAELGRLVRMLQERRVHEHTEMSVVLGSRRLRHAVEAAGWLSVFAQAGVRVLESGLPPDMESTSSPVGAGLCAASRGEHRPGRRTPWYLASIESCAAAALAGCVVDPRELEIAPAAEDLDEVLSDPRLLDIAPETDFSPPSAERARGWRAGGLERPLRGMVLIQVPDRARAADLLPLGARQEKLVNEVDALAAHACAPLDPSFAARARQHGGGFVLAGRELGGGEPAELAAVALRALGVRAILARSFAPGFPRRLVHAALLPVEFRHDADARHVQAGDELEFPGLPGALEPAKPLTVRNLTRGAQYTVTHRLDALDIAWLRQGGLLATAALDVAGATSRGR